MIVVIIVITVIAVILAVTLGLVFGLKKKASDGSGCSLKINMMHGFPKDYKDSCNSSLSVDNPIPKKGELYCIPNENELKKITDATIKNQTVNLILSGKCSKYTGGSPGVQPKPAPAGGNPGVKPKPKKCNINLNYSYPKRTPSPSSKIYLEEIKIQDTCSPGVNTAADYTEKTNFCYPNKQNVSDLKDFIKGFSQLTTDKSSLNIDGTCKPYPNVFSKCCAREN